MINEKWKIFRLPPALRPEPSRRHTGAPRFVFEFPPPGTKAGAGGGELIETSNERTTFVSEIITLRRRTNNRSIRPAPKRHTLAKVLDTLKQEYAKSMVYAYKNRSNYDFLNFIFSASSFNDAIKRVTYLKSYRSYREMQGDNILRTQNLLQQRIGELSGNKLKKNEVLQEKSKEMTELEKQQQEKQVIVSKLKGTTKRIGRPNS